MSNRDDIFNSLGVDIRRMLTIQPGRITVETPEDAANLVHILSAHPNLPSSLHAADPEFLQRVQWLEAVLNRPRPDPAAAEPKVDVPEGIGRDLPRNPMPMSRAIEQYRQGKLASGAQKLRTADDKQSLLTKLAAHVAVADPSLGPDPNVHEIETHHLTSFLNVIAVTNRRKARSLVPGATAAAAAPKTMKKKLSDISSFFEYAHSQLQATLVDPTVALDGRRKDLNTAASRQPRHYKPYSNQHLSLIFEPRRYLAFNREADYFWAPLLALHLGARLGELVTLSLDAIKQQDGSGIWFLTIDDENAKNSNSQRSVPISQHLVRLGFINYVRHLRRIGATELFPHRDMTSSTAQRLPSKNCSRKFHDYLQDLGLKETDADLVFHSFRHSVVQALLDNGTPLPDSMQLVGHLAQSYALKSGQLTAQASRSSHLSAYSHAGEVRLNVDNPLAKLKGHLDRCIVLPLDYLRLRRAAYIVTRQTVVGANGKFESGWSTLSKMATGHLARLK